MAQRNLQGIDATSGQFTEVTASDTAVTQDGDPIFGPRHGLFRLAASSQTLVTSTTEELDMSVAVFNPMGFTFVGVGMGSALIIPSRFAGTILKVEASILWGTGTSGWREAILTQYDSTGMTVKNQVTTRVPPTNNASVQPAQSVDLLLFSVAANDRILLSATQNTGSNLNVLQSTGNGYATFLYVEQLLNA